MNKILQGDCLEVMRTFEDNSIDTIITDPPYGLSFMGKKWDYEVPSVEIWQECLRVLKPGGTALIFAGSRTQHRMAVNIEDAGFILKDTIMWLYGSGFPKATDISKQIDKMAGAEREVIGKKIDISSGKPMSAKQAKAGSGKNINEGWDRPWRKDDNHCENMTNITAPATPEAQLWNGYKSHGLKPAYEPVLLCMKPNEGSYANNALKWGVAGLNIDGGRIETNDDTSRPHYNKDGFNCYGKYDDFVSTNHSKGRFPANIILDEEAARLLDEQSGDCGAHGGNGYFKQHSWMLNDTKQSIAKDDKQGASRFFYCAKASKKERNRGCEGLPLKDASKMSGGEETRPDRPTNHPLRTNHHPTVKPLSLMKYLVTLTMMPSPDQVYLDPFCGSGTTLMACKELGRNYIGIEKEEEYIKIAECRVKATQRPLIANVNRGDAI